MLGFSVLAPWNAVNVCLSYFANKYPTYNVNFLASIPAFVASAIFSYLYVIIQKHFKEKQRFYGSLSGLIIMMILFPIMANSLPNSDLGSSKFKFQRILDIFGTLFFCQFVYHYITVCFLWYGSILWILKSY
jgi:uncharacterized membrane protein YagU involved in acid resistance